MQYLVRWQPPGGDELSCILIQARQPLAQIWTLDILHHQIVMSTFGEVGVEVRNAVMFQIAQGPGLGLKALSGSLSLPGIGGIIVLDDLLENGKPVKCLGLGHQPDRPHPTFAQGAHDAVCPPIQQLFRLQAGSHHTERCLTGGAIPRAGPVHPAAVGTRNTQNTYLTKNL